MLPCRADDQRLIAALRALLMQPCLRGAWAMVLVAAFAVRALIPAGYMPVAEPQGIAITICTPHGVVAAQLPMERTAAAAADSSPDNPDDDHQQAGDLCAFALAHAGSLPWPPLPAVSAPLWQAAPAPAARALAEFTTHRLAAPPPPSQAPPALA